MSFGHAPYGVLRTCSLRGMRTVRSGVLSSLRSDTEPARYNLWRDYTMSSGHAPSGGCARFGSVSCPHFVRTPNRRGIISGEIIPSRLPSRWRYSSNTDRRERHRCFPHYYTRKFKIVNSFRLANQKLYINYSCLTLAAKTSAPPIRRRSRTSPNI